MKCKDCADYRLGGKCSSPLNKTGVTSPLRNAYDLECFNFPPEQVRRVETRAERPVRNEPPKEEVKPDTRVCKKCGRDLPLEKFRPTKNGSRLWTCQDCLHDNYVKGGKTRTGKLKPKPAPAPKEEAPALTVKLPVDVSTLPPVKDYGTREIGELVARLKELGWKGSLHLEGSIDL